MPETIMGMDPGKSGGIAVLREGDVPRVTKMPDTERDLWDTIDSIARTSKGQGCFCYLERAQARPAERGSRPFNYGWNYGNLRAFLIAAGIPFETVAPGVWQRKLGCLSGGDKNVTKARAQELFPEVKVTHAVADALLIAEFGRRVRRSGKGTR